MVKRKKTSKTNPLQQTPTRAATSNSPSKRNSASKSPSKRKIYTPKKRIPTTTVLSYIGNRPFQIFKSTLRSIRKLQHQTNHLIPKLPFSRVIREIMMEVGSDNRIQSAALEAIQEAAEIYLTYLFEDANKCAMHARRVTLRPNDIRLVLELRGPKDPGFHTNY